LYQVVTGLAFNLTTGCVEADVVFCEEGIDSKGG